MSARSAARRARWFLIALLIPATWIAGLCAVLCPPAASGSTSDGVVEFLVFDAPDCDACKFLTVELLPAIEEEYGPKVEYEYFSVGPEDFENYRKMINLESSYGRTEMAVPQVYIGEHALIGPDEIKDQLPDLVAGYAEAGGVDPPQVLNDSGQAQPTEKVAKAVYIAYFYRSACRQCDAIALELEYLRQYGTGIFVKEYDLETTSGIEMNEAMCEAFAVPEKERGRAPAAFVGSRYLSGKELNRVSLLAAIEEERDSQVTVNPRVEAERWLEAAREGIEERFRSIGVFTVIGAGLVDGLNPCAFTVLVFLVTYLAFIGRGKKEALMVGGGFTAAVFVTYFLIGIGLLGFTRYVAGKGSAGRWLSIAVACATAAFGLVAIYDYVRSRRTGKARATLGLGRSVTRKIHGAVRRVTKVPYLVAGAVVLGVLVTVLELGCTGQVYLPTIMFVARSGTERATAIWYLALYDLMFILPLVVVFVLVYLGTSQQKLAEFGRKHAAGLELVGGLALVALAALLFVTSV